MDTIERDGNLIRATGVFDDAGANGAEALRLVRFGALKLVSLCADDVDQADIETIYEMPAEPMTPAMPMMPDAGSPVADGAGDADLEFHLPGKHNQKDHGHPSAGGGRKGVMKWSQDQLKSFDKPHKVLHSEDSYRKRFAAVEGSVTADGAPELDVVLDGMDDMEMPEPTERTLYHAGRIRSATLVAEGAWVEAELTLGEPEVLTPTKVDVVTAAGGWTVTIPELWPEDWFNEPAPEDMPEFGGLRITASGRITGYIAPPNVVHRAYRPSGRSLTVPLGQDYSEFNNKPALVAADDGSVARINAGTITFNCGHPDVNDPRRAGGSGAVREMYDNSCSVFARVRVWESRNYPGTAIVAGALLHGIDADALERAMGCHLSGDWQGGKFNAALLVPNEGFPPSVAGSVRVREGQLVASSVPIAWEPGTRDKLESIAKRIGMDRETQFARLRERVGGEPR